MGGHRLRLQLPGNDRKISNGKSTSVFRPTWVGPSTAMDELMRRYWNRQQNSRQAQHQYDLRCRIARVSGSNRSARVSTVPPLVC